MNQKLLFLILIIFPFCFNVQAQEQPNIYDDYENYDTVIIVYDTIMVRDTVFEESYTPKKLSIGASVGAIMSLGNYKATNDVSNQTAELFNNSSFNSIGSSFQIDISYYHNSMVFQTGVGYSELRNKIAMPKGNNVYTTQYYTQTDTLSSYSQIVDGETITYYVTEDNTYSKDDSVLYPPNYINKYRYVSVPLLAGYVFVGNNIEFTVLGGICTNIAIANANNIMLYGDNKLRKIEKSDYRNIVFSGQLAAQLDFSVTEHINIFTQLKIEKYFQSIFTTGYHTGYKPFNIGLNVGAKYSF